MAHLKGFTLPRTPAGASSLAPSPPWHYVADALAVEFRTDASVAAGFLPDGLELESDHAAAFFIDWQSVTETGREYLDPIRSQYREAIFLLSAKFDGAPISYCPFIWVDQDVSLMRGLAQGWPKQIGSIWVTRAYSLPSKASPVVGPGGSFGATLAVKDCRLAEACIVLREKVPNLPCPGFAKAANLRYFPDLTKGNHDKPLIHQLVQLKSRDVQVGEIWKGEASFKIFDCHNSELTVLKPVSVGAGFRFSIALTVDDLAVLRDMNPPRL